MKNLTAVILCAIAMSAPLSAQASDAPASTQTLMSKLHWRSIGPYIGGRVVAVAGVPSNPDLFYMGGVQGGIWKSTNYGLSWDNISDGKIPGIADSIGAIAVAPSNAKIIYAGTGESDIRGDFDTGDGIYKSTDAGKTWHYAGLRETHMTSSLVIDPRDPNVVYATSMGHVFAPNPDRGVFKTTDGGKTWTKVLFVDDATGANDVVMDPKHPDTLYASMWQAQRTPWHLESGGPDSGVYKTTDGGAHWTKISTNPGFATGLLGKMGLAVAASDPNVVYAIVQANDGGVFRSSDGGATWHRVNSEWKLRQRAFYYMAIYVDPTNANTVFAPEVDSVWKSTNGGKAWKPLMPPGDHHIIWINPRNTNIMLEGDDGGATVSVDAGKTWSSENNQPTGQFYHITIDSQFPYHVYGAQQDEGAFEGPSASNEGLTLGVWHIVAFGESTYIAVDPRNPSVTYGAGYYSAFARLDTSTGEVKNVSPWPRYMAGASAAETKYRFGWTHPVMFSPVKPHELFETAQVVFKSDDFGQTWTIVSPDLTRNDKTSEGPSGGQIYYDQTGAETFPDIASFAISPLSANVMWAGSADGLVHVTTDGGANWKSVTPPDLPEWAQISSIEPSHSDQGTAFVTASRFMWDDYHPYVYKTTDYGATWTAMTTGIPSDQYVFVVREDPRESRVMFAGTRSTVYVSLDGGARWQPMTLNLPGVQVRDLAIDARQGEVAAATHGRAFWILDDLALVEQLARATDAGGATASAQLFAPETAWLSHAYGQPGFPIPNLGDNPDYGATVYFDIPKAYDGRTPATLTFLDASGKTVRSFDLHLRDKKPKELSFAELALLDQPSQNAYNLHKLTAIGPGMNKFQWDLRYAPATEVIGLHNATADDFVSGVTGATVVPGTYTVLLDYGGRSTRKTFHVALDPRLHPAPGDLEARLAFATRIGSYLDSLDKTVNAALAARSRMPAAQRAQVDPILDDLVQFNIRSSEGDLLHESRLHEQLAFLMNSLDLAYQAPTRAEYAAFDDLKALSDADLAKLQAAMKSP